MKIRKLIFNPFEENTYILFAENGEAAIIDPGCSNAKEQEILSLFIKDNNLKPKYLINTHCHFDHAIGNAFVAAKYHLLLYAHTADTFLLESLLQQAASFGIEAQESPKIEYPLNENTVLKLGNEELHFLHLPGHSPGSVALDLSAQGFVLVGDVLFKGSIGRTDLPQGDLDALMSSIRNKLFTLDYGTEVFPGHGPSTTIGVEVKSNPFLG